MPHDAATLPAGAIDPAALNARFAGNAPGGLAFALSGALGRMALVSSFGAESAVLLHMAAQVDRRVPVIFIDTLMLFRETMEYQQRLTRRLGLSDVRRVAPSRVALFQSDPDAVLHRSDPDTCCALRKTRPLEGALAGFDGWIGGRKRFQGGQRAHLQMFESEAGTGRIKVNPLVHMAPAELRDWMQRHDLPMHPLVARGYPSIGCAPCTTPAGAGEDPRAGRWRGLGKVECGIHIAGGRVVRPAVPA
jgi:phosphoadenosine phosphosulfate reductase